MQQNDNDLGFDDFQHQISMEDLLLSAGYQYDRKKSTRHSPVYAKLDGSGNRIGDRVLVNPRFNTCCEPPVLQNYNVISFITSHPSLFKEYKEGMKPHLLVNEVCRNILNMPKQNRETEAIRRGSQEREQFDLKKYQIHQIDGKDFSTVKPFFPYFKSRGIDLKTQYAFHHDFFLTTQERNGRAFTNLSFPMRIPGKEQDGIVGLEERGLPRMDGSSGYKGKAAGSNSSEGLWIANLGKKPLSESSHVYWFESGYDAMAYYQLHKGDANVKKGVFLSSGGNPTYRQFEGVLKEAKGAVHHLCFDEDLAGRQFVENFKQVASKLTSKREAIEEYRQSMKDESKPLSGNLDLLPDSLLVSYKKMETAQERYASEGRSPLTAPDEREELKKSSESATKEFMDKLKESLSSDAADVKVEREVPSEGFKDWNEELLDAVRRSSDKLEGGVDVDADGVVDSVQKKEESVAEKSTHIRR